MADALVKLVLSRHVWIFAVISVVFWLITMTGLEYHHANVWLQSLLIGVSAAVLTAYAPFAYQAVTTPKLDREDHLLLGIIIAWMGVLLRSAFIILWRVGWIGHDHTATITSHWINYFTLMIILGGVLHCTAPGSLNNRVPPRNLALLGLAFGGGAALASALLIFATKPDL